MLRLPRTILPRTILAGLCALAASVGAQDLNREISIKLTGLGSPDPAEAVCERLADHQALQAMIVIPAGKTPGGPLLDPNRVAVELDGKPVPFYLLYKNPGVALIFAKQEGPLTAPPAELTMTAFIDGGEEMAAGWRLPLSPTADQATRMTGPDTRTGRTIVIRDENGLPIPGARLFGQRREDLFAFADAEGRIQLDAANRSSAETHYAWTPESWVTRFDAIREPEPVLIPRAGNSRTKSIDLRLNTAEGETIEDAWLLVNDADWVRWRKGKSVRLPLRTDARNYMLVIAAGYQPKATVFQSKIGDRQLWMEPLAAGK